jgi:outer membrane protein assembly factor BamB
MKQKIFANSAMTLLAIVLTLSLTAQNASQWRGDNRRGIYSETGLTNFWPPEGPAMAWVNENVGNGFGSPSFSGERIYVTGEEDTTAYLYCLDLNGKQIWKTSFGKDWIKSFRGSRMSPTIHEGLIYVSSGIGNIACIDQKTGELKWMDESGSFHGILPMHGHSESPLVDGDLVFFTPGGAYANVVALDRFTGRTRWVCPGVGERPAYNSPLLVKAGETNLLLVFSAYHLMGIDAKTGKLLWTHEQTNTSPGDRKLGNGDTHSNTVWYENGFIYYIAGDGNGAVKLAVEDGGKSVRQVWCNSKVDNYMGGFILADGKIYSCSDSKKSLFCLNAETGEITDSLKCGCGTLISADKYLYYYTQRGEVNLIRPDKGKMERVSFFRVPKGSKEHFAHPVVYRGRLYIRHGNALMAYPVKKEGL